MSKASLRLGGATCVALLLIVGCATTARAQTTALYLESQAGDFVGAGEVHTYVPAEVTFTVSNTANVVNMSVIAPGFTNWWYLYFSASPGVPIGPGTYLSAMRYPFNGNSAGIDIFGNGRGCNELTGRFVIRELVLGAGDAVERLAVDFEQHCEDADAALFGALRYNSTVSTLIPFDGAYPDYRLTFTRPAHGSVTADGIACSPSESTCSRSLSAPGIVSVTAAPDPGYMFIGWRGSCRGPATIAVHVNQLKECEPLFDSTTSPTARTGLFLDSQSGDYIGQGQQWLYDGSTSAWTIDWTDPSHRAVRVNVSDLQYWTLEFDHGAGGVLTPGTYFGATRYPFNGSTAGLDVSGNGRGCNELTGRFVIRELVLGAGDAVERLAVDFEQHCEDFDPALFGALRYNSTVSTLIPFDGAYPDYRLTFTRPAHGSVTADGIACSPSESTCSRSLSAPGTVSVTAAPDPGYMFLGWRGSCRGPATIAVHVNQSKVCEALFDSTSTPTARTGLFLDSQPGDYIGQGRQWLYDGSTSAWTIDWTDPSHRALRVNVSDLQYWTLEFDHGAGGVLTPGTYFGATRYPFNGNTAGMTVYGNGRGCNESSGWFFVHELVTGTDGTILRFAADFEQHCEHMDPALYGVVRFNSTVPSLTPFDGNYPDFRLTIVPGAHGVVTGGGLDCGGAGNTCVQVLAMPATIALTATPDLGYTLTAWSGDCAGGQNTSIRVNGHKQCGPMFSVASPAVTANPANQTILEGERVQFTAAAFSIAPVTVQWQVSTNGGSVFTNIPGATGSTFALTALAAESGRQFRAAITNVSGTETTTAATLTVARLTAAMPTDFDGDAKDELVIWRPGAGTWYWTASSSGSNAAAGARQWGSRAAGDVPLTGDIDGDRKADLIVWRGTTGTWYWLTSSSGYNYAAAGSRTWGSAGDIPMLGDIDGDGKADLIIWRPATGTFFWLTSSSGYTYSAAGQKQWGSQGAGDTPMLGDFDGDGRADLTIWRATTGMWFWLTSSSGYSYAGARQRQWGAQSLGDLPLAADIDGDGKTDLVVWRGSTGTWFWLTSSSGYSDDAQGQKQWGSQGAGDVPFMPDVDGDGKADLAVWRGSTGTWYWVSSRSGYDYGAAGSKAWGVPGGDVPIGR